MKQCSIYFVERPNIEGDSISAHTFLVRVDETHQTLLEQQANLKVGETKRVHMDQIHIGSKNDQLN
jgi:hypothetical protein